MLSDDVAVDADLERLTRLAKAVRIKLGELGNALVHWNLQEPLLTSYDKTGFSEFNASMAEPDARVIGQPKFRTRRNLWALIGNSAIRRHVKTPLRHNGNDEPQLRGRCDLLSSR